MHIRDLKLTYEIIGVPVFSLIFIVTLIFALPLDLMWGCQSYVARESLMASTTRSHPKHTIVIEFESDKEEDPSEASSSSLLFGYIWWCYECIMLHLQKKSHFPN